MHTQHFLPEVQFTWQSKVYEVKEQLSEDEVAIEDVNSGDKQIISFTTLIDAFYDGQLALTAENAAEHSTVLFEVDHTVIDVYVNEKSRSAKLGVIERCFSASNKSLEDVISTISDCTSIDSNQPSVSSTKITAFVDPFTRLVLPMSVEIKGEL